jgi:hypothetical protein
MLDESGHDAIAARHGKILFDRADIARATEFQGTLKERFGKELATLAAS